MAYQHPLLGSALGWQHNHTPGICTKKGSLTAWPAALGAAPSDTAQAQVVAEYTAYLASSACKDDEITAFLASAGGRVARAIIGVGIDKGLWTLAELKAKYRTF